MADTVITWISVHILPHEPAVRRWLRRIQPAHGYEDDIIQEAYCRIASIVDCSHIMSGRNYFFATARNIILERMRRDRIVKIEAMAEIETLCILDDKPSVEHVVSSRQQLQLVQEMIEALPPRCRDVFVMRKVEQLSQRQTAERLGITENIVEKEVARGLRLLLLVMAKSDEAGDEVEIG
ncbi:sigma-70 family RNA polymerase sigma factor [Sphingobium sp.]|uniref:RNA polymerase sigma factor n=1 Tax=Sphingobium sp. TaxID=1912891 RepID=UPI0028BF18E9|nr:sigma-70 family RNA polymerase sigma factor [Sphingobium sp.]